MEHIKEEIFKLVALLNKYSYDYYVEDNPQISDTRKIRTRISRIHSRQFSNTKSGR